MFSSMAETKRPFIKNFQGFTYCSVFKVRCFASLLFSAATLIVYHIVVVLSTTFFIFFNFFLNLFQKLYPVARGVYYNNRPTKKCQQLFPIFFIFFQTHFCSVFGHLPVHQRMGTDRGLATIYMETDDPPVKTDLTVSFPHRPRTPHRRSSPRPFRPGTSPAVPTEGTAPRRTSLRSSHRAA